MKIFYARTILSFLFFAVIAPFSFSQSPHEINYQAIARDAAGNPLVSQSISVKFIIHRTAANGPVSCSETQSITTNPFGLFTWAIGSSNHPALDTIAWGKRKYFLEVVVNTISMGSTQLLSVPYALHAHTADSIAGNGFIQRGFTNMSVFNTVGTSTFTIPNGVVKIMVEVWGGGGGGSVGASVNGGGGGGGGYGKEILSVTPGNTFTITVGAGGGPGAAGGGLGTSGGTSIFGSIIANGGNAGNNNASPSGGSGGTVSGASYSIVGQTGFSGGTNSVPSGGSAPAGGFGGTYYQSGGQPGFTPGGGGAGANNTTSGGGGAPGRVVVWF